MRCVYCGLAVLALSVAALWAEEKAAARADFLAADNWVGLKEYWKVEGNTITGLSTEGLKFNTFLCSKKVYKDFELSFQVRLKDGKGNSGVQIRSKVVEMAKYVVAGPQCDIGAGYWGSLYGERFNPKNGDAKGGMMKQSPKAEVEKVLKANDFNDYSIVVVGKKVTIQVNGVKCVDEEFPVMPEEGIIAWQLHAGPPMEVTFRNIKFTEK